MSAMNGVSIHKQPWDYGFHQCPKPRCLHLPNSPGSNNGTTSQSLQSGLTPLLSWPQALRTSLICSSQTPHQASLEPQKVFLEPSLGRELGRDMGRCSFCNFQASSLQTPLCFWTVRIQRPQADMFVSF